MENRERFEELEELREKELELLQARERCMLDLLNAPKNEERYKFERIIDEQRKKLKVEENSFRRSIIEGNIVCFQRQYEATIPKTREQREEAERIYWNLVKNPPAVPDKVNPFGEERCLLDYQREIAPIRIEMELVGVYEEIKRLESGKIKRESKVGKRGYVSRAVNFIRGFFRDSSYSSENVGTAFQQEVKTQWQNVGTAFQQEVKTQWQK